MPNGALGTELIHIAGSIGVDEAGRGPLAGPVVAAAVMLPGRLPPLGLNDSKKLSPEKRESLAEWIQSHAWFSIQFKTSAEIDSLNILRASLEAMADAIEDLDSQLAFSPDLAAGFQPDLFPICPREVMTPEFPVYVDGNQPPPRIERSRLHLEVKGDGRFAAIAAASILAKTTRDKLMVAYSLEFPEFGFDRNFGYPTPDHLAALERFGPCPIHRKSYAPVRACLSVPTPESVQPELFCHE